MCLKMTIFSSQPAGMNDLGQKHEENDALKNGKEYNKDKEENNASALIAASTNEKTASKDNEDAATSNTIEQPGQDPSSFACSRDKSFSRQTSLASDESGQKETLPSPCCRRRSLYRQTSSDTIESDGRTNGGEEDSSSPSPCDPPSSTASLDVSGSTVTPPTTTSANTIDCPVNGYGGARPKTTQNLHLPPMQNVSVPSSNSQSSSQEKRELEKHRHQLLSVRIPDVFYKSAPVKALHFMLGQNNKDQQILTEMAVKYLKVKLNRFPTSSELLGLLLDCDMEKEAIVKKFLEFTKRPEKNATASKNLHRNVLEHVSKQNAQRTTNQQVSMQTSTETESDIGSASLLSLNFDDINSNSTHIDPSVSEHASTNYDSLSETTKKAADLSQKSATSLLEQGQNHGSPNIQEKPPAKAQTKNVRLRAVETENIFLKERLTCIECNERPIEITVLPCSHFMLCEQCADKNSHCPFCKEKILAEVKTYMS